MKTFLLFATFVSFCASSAFAKSPILTEKEARQYVISAPRPKYPQIAQDRRITGSGVVMIDVTSDGHVANVWMFQTTGSEILDNAAITGFKRWRFRPGRAFVVRTPITFTMAGAQFFAQPFPNPNLL